MDLALTGKRALVTGATSGLGAEIARTLAAEGVVVAIGGRDLARAKAVAQSIRDAGGIAVLALGDLTDDAAADACVHAAADALGGIDILVNALGYSPTIGRGLPDGDWAAAYRALTLPGVRMIHRVAPMLKESGWGRIIQIASADALTPAAVPQSYASAKAAIANMSLGLAKAFSGTGITVNTLSPGLIHTPAYALEDAAGLIDRHGRQPVAGLAPLKGVAAMAAWLASPLADHVTGANIRMDGGFSPAIN
ncbi:MAG: SDR family oxidoreductase [Sphingomonadales bacterium]|nr:MAG: SDR family oxidoreductase [Sphingomonadales bacterium]